MAGCVYITSNTVTNDYTTYVHGEAYQGPSKTTHPYKQQYEKWLAGKASYYRSQGIYTELGTVGGYSVGVRGVTEERIDKLLNTGGNIDSQIVLSEESALRLIEDAKQNTSLSSWDTWFKENEETLKFVNAKEWGEIQSIFEKKKSGMTEELLKETLEKEKDPRLQDNDLTKAVRNGTYLPNRIAGNIMDEFQTPMYYIRFFMIKREKVIEMHKSIDENVVEKTAFKFLRPDPDDIVVIAETGATDLIIDDLEILHFDKSGPATFADTTFSWTITEPGSISLLDRLSAAKVFCDYVQGSGASLSTGAGDVPYYMEVSLRGYKDDTEDIDAGEGTVTDITGPFIFELGYLKFDMSIGPEGAVYNFSSHSMDSVAEFSQFARIPRDIDISGQSLPQLLRDFEVKLNSAVREQHEGHEVDQTKLNTYVINYDGVFKDPGQTNEPYFLPGGTNEDYEGRVNKTTSRVVSEIDPDGDGLYGDQTLGPEQTTQGGVEINPNGIDAYIYADPSRIIDQTLKIDPDANPQLTTMESVEDLPTDEFSGNFNEGAGDRITVSLSGPGRASNGLFDRLNNDKIIIDLQGEDLATAKAVLTAPELVTMNIKADTPIPDAISSIMGLSYDLIKKGTRLKDPEDPEGDVNKDQTYLTWFKIGGTVNYDYDQFSEASHSYKATIEYRVRLIEEARTDIGLSSTELAKILDEETTANRIQELGIAKEYLYYFTGLNDQIINFDLSFDEAYVITVPIFGKRDHKAQLAYASSSSMNIDEKNNVAIDYAPNDKVLDSAKKKGLLNFFDEVSDLVGKGGSLLGTTSESELRASIGEIASGLGYNQTDAQLIAENIQDKNNARVKQFQEMLASEEIAQDLVNSVIVKGKISEQANTTTSSDNQEGANGDEITNNVPLFASEIVPGLEGDVADPRVSEGYLEVMEKDYQRKLQILKRDSGKNKTGPDVPAERGSIRQTSFAHLMNAHQSGAISSIQIDMELRGDPWYMGKGNFYDGNNDEGPTTDSPTVDSTDLAGISYNGGSNQFLLAIESPRKLDFDTSDEDNNTGLYNYQHLNYTMSGIYIITSATSKFSGGMYTTDITAFQNQAYNMARVVAVKKVVDQRVSEYMATIGDATIGSGAQENIEDKTFSLDESGDDESGDGGGSR
tara:strand:- start:29890 stop:33327 length:3438 start_codon:yes stop_codon:yes gene_type:complete